jgi:hypothetical protein
LRTSEAEFADAENPNANEPEKTEELDWGNCSENAEKGEMKVDEWK